MVDLQPMYDNPPLAVFAGISIATLCYLIYWCTCKAKAKQKKLEGDVELGTSRVKNKEAAKTGRKSVRFQDQSGITTILEADPDLAEFSPNTSSIHKITSSDDTEELAEFSQILIHNPIGHASSSSSGVDRLGKLLNTTGGNKSSVDPENDPVLKRGVATSSVARRDSDQDPLEILNAAISKSSAENQSCVLAPGSLSENDPVLNDDVKRGVATSSVARCNSDQDPLELLNAAISKSTAESQSCVQLGSSGSIFVPAGNGLDTLERVVLSKMNTLDHKIDKELLRMSENTSLQLDDLSMQLVSSLTIGPEGEDEEDELRAVKAVSNRFFEEENDCLDGMLKD